MKQSMTKLSILITAALFVAGTTYANKDKAEYEGIMKDIPHATISFNPNSALLSEPNRTTLRDMIREAREKGKISKVKVAAWSDRALPAKGNSLLESDRDLAKDRSDMITSFLKTELEIGSFDTFNMAETSNWLARTFKTEDAELKSVFSKKGAKAPITKAEFQVIKNEGGQYTAVVIVERPAR